MKVSEILALCGSKGIHLSLADEKLQLASKDGDIPADVLSLVKQHKSTIIEFLANFASKQAIYSPIEIAPHGERIPLSYAQEGFWFLNQYLGPNSVSNVPMALRFNGAVDEAALIHCISLLVERHGALRTRFEKGGAGVYQVVDPDLVRLSAETVVNAEALRRVCREERAYPFDLSKDSLCRIRLLRCPAENCCVLMVTMHHAITDGWSMDLFRRELLALYQASKEGISHPLQNLPIRYTDYAVWQRRLLGDEVTRSRMTYWHRALSGLPPVLALPTDRPRPIEQTYTVEKIGIPLPAALWNRLQELSRDREATLFMTLLAMFSVLLSRYSGQRDFAIGTPVAGRLQKEVEGVIGCFINTLVIRCDLHGNPSFEELLERIKDVALGAYAHEDVPFQALVEELNPPRSPGHSPLFQVLFALNRRDGSQSRGDPDISPFAFERDQEGPKDVLAAGVSQFDLALLFHEGPSSTELVLMFNKTLFDRSTARRMLRHQVTLLQSLGESPKTRIFDVDFLSEDDKSQLLHEWSTTALTDVSAACVHHHFERQVEEIPDAIAATDGRMQLSYRELNRRANLLAHYLLSEGVERECRIGIVVEREVQTLVGILGILKAGACYVPLDPDHPPARSLHVLENSGARLVLIPSSARTGGASGTIALARRSRAEIRWVELDRLPSADVRWEANPGVHLSSSNLAYVMYTSGSTGVPKGVAVHQGGWSNVTESQVRLFGIDRDSRLLQFVALTFDVAAADISMALSAGATLFLCSDTQRQSPEELATCVRRQEISCGQVPMAMLGALEPATVDCIHTLIVGGEACTSESLAKWSKGRTLFNVYGLTETTIASTCFRCEQAFPAIGRPLPNTSCYVLDGAGALVPAGVCGELYIGGVQLARGYLGNPALTAERFVPHPFGRKGERLYRSGDLVRHLPDGNLEFIGRIDEQVKIRGFRIELGEIEARLQEHGSVNACAVLAREDAPGEKQLVAYVVLADEAASEAGEENYQRALRRYLEGVLPAYMVPSAYVRLDAMPLTPHGKVDRKALPMPDAGAYEREAYCAPRNETERAFVGIWSELLRLEPEEISVHANFFALGGHSLLATRLVNLIQVRFGVELPLRTVFESPSLGELAGSLSSLAPVADRLPLVPVGPEHVRPLSFAQERLWFLAQLEGSSAHYNMPLALRLTGALDRRALVASLTTIVSRHEVLRTRFAEDGGVAYQVVEPASVFTVSEEDVGSESDLRRLCIAEGGQAFDLRKAPLIRARLLRQGDHEHLLLVTMHHSVSDGWSMQLFFRELTSLYRAYSAAAPSPLPALPIQYSDYAYWQRQWLVDAELARQEAYWKERLRGLEGRLTLPTDRPRPAVKTYNGARVPLHGTADLQNRIQRLSEQENVTVYMTLLAAFSVLIGRYSGECDIAVGSPIANRNRPEVESLIGFFVNTLVLRTDLSGDPRFVDLLARVKDVALGAYSHQDIPFERVVEVLQPVRSLSYSPLFQVMFALQEARGERQVGELAPGLSITPTGFESSITKFDLSLTVRETASGLSGGIEYNSDLFDRATIERFASHYLQLLEGIVAAPAAQVSQYDILSPAERHQQVVAWNDTRRAYPDDVCIHELFEAQVERTPAAVAVVYEDQQLTYAELNARANRVAHCLIAAGVKPDTLVGLCVERSPEMVIGLLGILKAGGAYVPLDPTYPVERLRYMLEDSGVDIVLSQSLLVPQLPLTRQRVLCLDDDSEGVGSAALDKHSSENIPTDRLHLGSRHLAYVIYTSGSTGTPKGVMIEHRSWVNLAILQVQLFGAKAESRGLQFASLSFDAAPFEMSMILIRGAALHVLTPGQQRTPAELASLIAERAITHALLPPLLLRHLPRQQLSSLTSLVVGGEAISASDARVWSEGRKLFNGYGPTEATVCATVGILDSERVIIGKPLSNCEVYVLREMQLLPLGATGELCIGGAGVARGYLNRAALTAEKFAPNPFSDDPAARLYRTGDLARWLPDGNLEFIGRIDDQVTIRGFRIETGEIEGVLMRHGGIKEVVVRAREESDGGKQLLAYVVARAAADAGAAAGGDEREAALEFKESLFAHARKYLPDYMVPRVFIVLDQLPVTASGKVDTKALPAPEGDDYVQPAYAAPRNPTEAALVEVLAELLQLKPGDISLAANFFSLGGHSLLIMKLVSALKSRARLVEVRDVFDTKTLRELAARMDQCERENSFAASHETVPREDERPGEALPPLLQLTEAENRMIEAKVPGGADNIQDIYPLGPLQEGILFHHLMDPERDPYVFDMVLTVGTDALLQQLISALQVIVDRHDVLRTAIISLDTARSAQVVLREAKLRVYKHRFGNDGERRTKIDALRAGMPPMQIDEAPLIRILAASDDAERSQDVLLQFHHIIWDHVSGEVFWPELRAIVQGDRSALGPPQQYRNFIARSLRLRQDPDAAAYFASQLGTLVEPTLPFGLADVRGDGFVIDEFRHPLDEGLSGEIRKAAKDRQVSPAVLFHLAWAVVVGICSARTEVVFGTVLSGRMSMPGLDGAMGLYMNTLPFKLDLAGKSALELVRLTDEALRQLVKYEQMPLAIVQNCSGVKGGQPLFSALMNYRHSVRSAAAGRASELHSRISIVAARERTNYPFVVSVNDRGNSFSIDAQIDGRIGAQRVAEYLATALDRVVHILNTDATRPLDGIDVLSPSERNRVLAEWNSTAKEYPVSPCIHELFEEQVERTPEAIALVFNDIHLSFELVNKLANRVAHYLLRKGIRPEGRVGLCLDRSVEMVVGLLGIVKAGGCYVPMDPDYPVERLDYIRKDSRVSIILTHSAHAALAPDDSTELFYLDEMIGAYGSGTDTAGQAGHNLAPAESGLISGNLVYLIYTSGSSGRPKGVSISHDALCNRIDWMQKQYPLTGDDKVLQKTSFSFDVSVWEFFWPLQVGATLVMAEPGGHKDPSYLRDLIQRQSISILHFVPSMLSLFLRDEGWTECGSIRHVICSGEALKKDTQDEFFIKQPRTGLQNLYGPTEAAIDVSYWACRQDSGLSTVPIGLPIQNTALYIADSQLNLLPIGVPGEIFIAGKGLSRGYLNKPGLTAEKFVPNPFGTEGGERLYRTGDLGRFLSDGNIEYIRRLDDQVKIRGVRIELAEIESVLAQHELVHEVSVILRQQQGEPLLIAFVVLERRSGENVHLPGADAASITEELRRFSFEKLPTSMVPNAFVSLDRFPLSPNGKLDKKALASLEVAAHDPGYEAPADSIEQSLAEFWSSLLSRPRIGRHDNFFDLGGHSLSATQLVSRVRTGFGIALSISEIFNTQVLSAQASIIRNRLSEPQKGKERASLRQRRLRQNVEFLEQHEGKLDVGEI